MYNVIMQYIENREDEWGTNIQHHHVGWGSLEHVFPSPLDYGLDLMVFHLHRCYKHCPGPPSTIIS